MTADKIKTFYDKIQFPGPYGQAQIDYHKHAIKNPYLHIINLAIDRDQQILDVGCGTGYITNLLAQMHPDCKFTAIDFANGIDYGRAFARQQGTDNVTWIKADFLEHSFDQQYDVIVCQGVFHHMIDPDSTLQKLKDSCRPGGKIVFGVYHPFGKILKQLIDLDYASHILWEDQERNPHERSYSCGQVLGMFSDFELLDVYPTSLPILAHAMALINSKNGGLTTYVLAKPPAGSNLS